MKWLGKKADKLPAFVDTLLPSQRGDVLELDELWRRKDHFYVVACSCVGSRATNDTR